MVDLDYGKREAKSKTIFFPKQNYVKDGGFLSMYPPIPRVQQNEKWNRFIPCENNCQRILWWLLLANYANVCGLGVVRHDHVIVLSSRP